MIKISEDQNKIEIDGVVYVAEKSFKFLSCQECDYYGEIGICDPIPCTRGERIDEQDSILKLKS